MLALDFPFIGFQSKQCLDGIVYHAHHSLPPSSVEKSQDEHGGNVVLMTFCNLIVDKLATDFQRFLQNFQPHICQKIVDYLFT